MVVLEPMFASVPVTAGTLGMVVSAAEPLTVMEPSAVAAEGAV